MQLKYRIPYIYQYNTNILYYIITIGSTIYTNYTNYTKHNYHVSKLSILGYFLPSVYMHETSGIVGIFGIVCQPLHIMVNFLWYSCLVLYRKVI